MCTNDFLWPRTNSPLFRILKSCLGLALGPDLAAVATTPAAGATTGKNAAHILQYFQ